MGRPSKLTPKQWDALERRLLAGERAADLSREYGVSKTAISARFSKRIETVKAVANQLVSAEASLRALPLSEQLSALTLADELRAISSHLAGAAKFGAATAHRLAGIAHAKVHEVDDAAPLTKESRESLQDIAVLTKIANEASLLGKDLLTINREVMKEVHQAQRPLAKRIDVMVVDASMPRPDA
jgi:hypothetical protein